MVVVRVLGAWGEAGAGPGWEVMGAVTGAAAWVVTGAMHRAVRKAESKGAAQRRLETPVGPWQN